MINWSYNVRRDAAARINRKLTQWRMASPVHIQPDRPIVSFTFDDFPKSAVNGADIVESYGGKAGFFACSIMAGKTGPYGEMFDGSTLAELRQRGHEIGSHTHSHLNCSEASLVDAMTDIDENIRQLRELGHDDPITSLAFPYGETRFPIKASASERFDICRGVAKGTNVGLVDRAHLRAIELSPDQCCINRAMEAVRKMEKQPGWLILFSHDVGVNPTQFGVTPSVLRDLCVLAKDIGADLYSPTIAAKRAGVF